MKNTLVENKTTWFLDGKKTVVVKIYDRCKYDAESKKIAEVEYEIDGYAIYNGEDYSEEDYQDIVNNDMVDEYDEYLTLWTGGHRAGRSTFRNSHVDMFLK